MSPNPWPSSMTHPVLRAPPFQEIVVDSLCDRPRIQHWSRGFYNQCIKGDEIGNSFILRVCTKLFHPALVALVRRRRGLWSLVLNGGRSMEVNGAWVVPFVAVDRVGERQSRGVQR